MAHHFLEAPDDATVEEAIRWGQIRALGGDETLARALTGTHLGRTFEHDKFWLSVVRWLIEHPLLDPRRIAPIFDYIRHQKFVASTSLVGGRLCETPPPQPNFSMKGRSPETLLEQVQSWHRHLAGVHQGQADWSPSGIAPFRFVAKDEESGETMATWTIRELLSSQALLNEGREMHHCVGSYAYACAEGTSSIWTMDVETVDGRRKLLTIEVERRTRAIRQACGKYNALPDAEAVAILRHWATAAGLSAQGISAERVRRR